MNYIINSLKTNLLSPKEAHLVLPFFGEISARLTLIIFVIIRARALILFYLTHPCLI
jgi:hypothetical protein